MLNDSRKSWTHVEKWNFMKNVQDLYLLSILIKKISFLKLSPNEIWLTNEYFNY